jgi:DNA mismatch repair protein MutS
MLTIHDLHFQNEIVPLFDHVYNEFARDVLLQWMTDRPSSVDEIYARQDILKALIGHDHLYRPFAYTRTEFHEAFSYLKEVGARQATGFFFSRVRRSREIGQLSNLFIFFHKIDEAWFRDLRMTEFPDEFRQTITRIRRIFSDLELKRNYDIVRSRSLTATELPRLTRLVKDKIRTGEVDEFWNDFFFFEACLSLAKGIVKHQFRFPAFIKEGLFIKGFYHPLIHNPVVNNIEVTETVTLITGPNMSGKSTLLKSIGLCVTLAHLGLAVPAEKCELPWFEFISIAINLNDGSDEPEERSSPGPRNAQVLCHLRRALPRNQSRRCPRHLPPYHPRPDPVQGLLLLYLHPPPSAKGIHPGGPQRSHALYRLPAGQEQTGLHLCPPRRLVRPPDRPDHFRTGRA